MFPLWSRIIIIRVNIFLKKYKSNQLERIKGINAGMLPPCKDVLVQKLARCNLYVAYLWKHANEKDPIRSMKPTDHGWKESNGIFVPVWFTGRQMPTILSTTMDPTDISNEEEEDDDDDDDNGDDDDSDDNENDTEDVSDDENDSDNDYIA